MRLVGSTASTILTAVILSTFFSCTGHYNVKIKKKKCDFNFVDVDAVGVGFRSYTIHIRYRVHTRESEVKLVTGFRQKVNPHKMDCHGFGRW